MANNIELAKKYLPLLDEVYSASAKTAILDAPAELVREGASAKQILIPSVALEGLADYSRSAGFETGDVDFSWEAHEFSQDRGRAFIIDAQDNAETLDVALVATTGQFIRTKVVPEVDAYRIAKMATEAIDAGNFDDADLDKDSALQAIDAGLESMMEKEVDLENVVIFVSPKVHTMLKQSNLIVRQFDVQAAGGVNRVVETLDGRPVITVPQNRMYTEIDLTDNGYEKADGAFDINFLIVDPQAVLGIKKTDLPRIFSPDVYQSANAWKFDYRLYHDLFVPANKVDGLFVHTEAQSS